MATVWTGFSEEEQNKIKGELNRISTAKQKQVFREIAEKTKMGPLMLSFRKGALTFPHTLS